jgi:hypothetical protein
MKAVLLMVAATLAVSGSCGAGHLGVTGLRASYRFGARIPFTIHKSASGAVTFCCAAEKLIDGRFEERRWDIFQSALKVAFRRPGKITSESLNLRWDIPKQPQPIWPEPSSVYRLRIDVVSPKQEHIYSAQFAITPPSNQTMQPTASPRTASVFDE